jgi:hypothetical protein
VSCMATVTDVVGVAKKSEATAKGILNDPPYRG